MGFDEGPPQCYSRPAACDVRHYSLSRLFILRYIFIFKQRRAWILNLHTNAVNGGSGSGYTAHLDDLEDRHLHCARLLHIAFDFANCCMYSYTGTHAKRTQSWSEPVWALRKSTYLSSSHVYHLKLREAYHISCWLAALCWEQRFGR